MSTLTVEQLKAKLDQGEDLALLDVRTPEEWELCRIPGATLIPLNELPHRFAELDPARPTVVMCHHGVRSQHAIAFLQQRHGFANLLNLQGGLHAWAVRIDPTMPRY